MHTMHADAKTYITTLHRLSEIGVRAVADLAGMPNWDWVPDAEVALQSDRYILPASLICCLFCCL